MEETELTTYTHSIATAVRVINDDRLLKSTEADARATLCLFSRILNTCQTIHSIRRFSDHPWGIDGECLLRISYDATLQLLYLLYDPIERRERAERYLGFQWIERRGGIVRADRSDTETGRWLSKSPDRPVGEAVLRRELRRVGPRFLTPKGQQEYNERGDEYLWSAAAKYQRNWYGASLDKIARHIGYHSEYEFMQYGTSASIHSSSIRTEHGPTIRERWVTIWSVLILLRCIGAIARSFDISLTEEELQVVERANVNFYNHKPSASSG